MSKSGLIKSCQNRSNQFGSWERSSQAGTGQVIYGKVKLDRGHKIFWTSTFLGPNIFLNQKFILDQFFGPIFLLRKSCYYSKFVWTQYLIYPTFVRWIFFLGSLNCWLIEYLILVLKCGPTQSYLLFYFFLTTSPLTRII